MHPPLDFDPRSSKSMFPSAVMGWAPGGPRGAVRPRRADRIDGVAAAGAGGPPDGPRGPTGPERRRHGVGRPHRGCDESESGRVRDKVTNRPSLPPPPNLGNLGKPSPFGNTFRRKSRAGLTQRTTGGLGCCHTCAKGCGPFGGR